MLADADAITRGGPVAIAEAKQLVRAVSRLSIEDGFAYAADKIATLFGSDEASEGMAAFNEKRPAAWVSKESDGS